MSIDTELSKEAIRIEEDATHSGKAHYEAAGRWRKLHLAIGLPATLIAAAGGILSLKEHPALAAAFALSAAALSALQTFLNPEGRASAHSAAGAAYLALKNRARSFANIQLKVSQDLEAKEATFLEIAARREELNSGSPEIPRWAFDAARKGIQGGEDKYRVDESKRLRGAGAKGE